MTSEHKRSKRKKEQFPPRSLEGSERKKESKPKLLDKRKSNEIKKEEDVIARLLQWGRGMNHCQLRGPYIGHCCSRNSLYQSARNFGNGNFLPGIIARSKVEP